MLKPRVAACLLSLCCGCAHQAAAPVAPPAVSSSLVDAEVSGYGSGTEPLEVGSAAARSEEQAEDPAERQLKLAQARAAGCGVGLR